MRTMYGRSERINLFASEGISDTRAAVPNGHLAPSAWILPQVAGGMSSRNEAAASISASGTGAQGINLVGNSVLTIVVAGSAAAVAAASGTSSCVITVSGNAVAPLSVVGSASASISAAATHSTIANISGSSVCAVSASLITGAIAYLTAQPITSDLTADSIASSVLGAMNAAPPGVNIKYVNDVEVGGIGTSGDPWSPV